MPKEHFAFPYTIYKVSNNALGQHGVGDLDKTSNIGTFNIVTEAIPIFAIGDTGIVNIRHYGLKTIIHFLPGPTDSQRVLGHFQA